MTASIPGSAWSLLEAGVEAWWSGPGAQAAFAGRVIGGAAVDTVRPIVGEAVAIWISGGWGMVALALNGLVIYSLGMNLLLRMWSQGWTVSPDGEWRRWLGDPARVRGPMGALILQAMARPDRADATEFFEHVRAAEIDPFRRDLKFMNTCVSAAPLLGLLGTVTGMLATFQALATGGGGDQTMDMVASGISEALITTETGLVIALSGLIFQFALTRQHDAIGKNIAHLETLCLEEHRRRETAAPRRAAA